MNFLLKVSLALLLLSFSEGFARAEDSMVVIGNRSGSLDLDLLRNIYFQNGGRLADGRVVTPIDFREDLELREKFYMSAFGKSKMQMKAHWAQKIFSGKGNPPISVENEKDALNLLLKEKSVFYISYMKETDVPKDVFVLLRIAH